ncbi:MAG: Asp-tRNA(Asn)/Glu-tRNA(Gln) amidotransferase subunit GatB [Candidatus Diapherotrites archaeon]|nr:Asp-tRNA(Asn)/Glu-tRNA(Gln) amidotransferase subunit GatB [Candidatus Diapherotrites archaeon]
MRIGFEIHVQLKTESKLFCPCPTNYWEAEPNSNVCPVCLGLPGSKPHPVNEESIRKALMVALSLGMEVKPKILFLRKHYFYPDLPSGYQRTSTPLAVNGRLGKVRIREIHVEEDPGRYDLKEGLVDFNRSGVSLIEIVTEPDMTSVEEAETFLKDLHLLLTYLGVILNPSVVFRVDANISLEGGERVEIKNINSIESVKKALRYEILRQKRLLESGRGVKRETRHWDEARGVTVSLRVKETEEDYRYMPDPDIPPVSIDPSLVEELRSSLPELPWERKERFVREYGVDRTVADALVRDKALGEFFEEKAGEISPKFWAEFLTSRLKGELNYRGLDFSAVPSKEGVFLIAKAWHDGRITKEAAVELLRKLLDGEIGDVSAEIEKFSVVENVEDVVREVVEAFPEVVEDYRKGKKAAINRLVGEVMKRTRGRADARRVRELLEKLLS